MLCRSRIRRDPARKSGNAPAWLFADVTTVAEHASLKVDVGEVRDQLRENGPACIHPPLFRP